MSASGVSATEHLLHEGVALVNLSGGMKVGASQRVAAQEQLGAFFVSCHHCLWLNIERQEVSHIIFTLAQRRPC